MRDDFLTAKPSTRPYKVGEAVRKALSEIFLRGETHIPRLDSASITVSEVRITPDLRNATAYVMPLAGSNQKEIMGLLAEFAPQIRHLLAKKVVLRYMPVIHYRLDKSFEEAQRVSELLNKPEVKRDLSEE